LSRVGSWEWSFDVIFRRWWTMSVRCIHPAVVVAVFRRRWMSSLLLMTLTCVCVIQLQQQYTRHLRHQRFGISNTLSIICMFIFFFIRLEARLQANSASYPKQDRKWYLPKCGDALRLGSKGRYDSFHLWINVWVAVKTVWPLVNTCHTWAL